jgi:hypothetical protein
MRDQVSHPYKRTGRIMVLYILTFTLLESRQEDICASLPGLNCAISNRSDEAKLQVQKRGNLFYKTIYSKTPIYTSEGTK